MSIRISSFLGKFGFEARRIAPNLASSAYLKLQFMTRGTIQDQYIKWFMEQDETPMPQVVNIETINRCNSTCSFCTANVHAEKRPFMKIEDGLYRFIIDTVRQQRAASGSPHCRASQICKRKASEQLHLHVNQRPDSDAGQDP